MVAIIIGRDNVGNSNLWRCSHCGKTFDQLIDCGEHSRWCFNKMEVKKESDRQKRITRILNKAYDFYKDENMDSASLQKAIVRKAIELAIIDVRSIGVKKNAGKK